MMEDYSPRFTEDMFDTLYDIDKLPDFQMPDYLPLTTERFYVGYDGKIHSISERNDGR